MKFVSCAENTIYEKIKKLLTLTLNKPIIYFTLKTTGGVYLRHEFTETKGTIHTNVIIIIKSKCILVNGIQDLQLQR